MKTIVFTRHCLQNPAVLLKAFANEGFCCALPMTTEAETVTPDPE